MGPFENSPLFNSGNKPYDPEVDEIRAKQFITNLEKGMQSGFIIPKK